MAIIYGKNQDGIFDYESINLKGFCNIPVELVTNKDLRMNSKFLYCILEYLRIEQKSTSILVNRRELANYLGVTNRAITNYLNDLEDAGFIKREENRSGDGRKKLLIKFINPPVIIYNDTNLEDAVNIIKIEGEE